MRIYLASSSRGDRERLYEVAQVLSRHYFVFAPCLGFAGLETAEIRREIMKICFNILNWADALVVFDEGFESRGVFSEVVKACLDKKPVAFFSFNNFSPCFEVLPSFSLISNLLEWLNGL